MRIFQAPFGKIMFWTYVFPTRKLNSLLSELFSYKVLKAS